MSYPLIEQVQHILLSHTLKIFHFPIMKVKKYILSTHQDFCYKNVHVMDTEADSNTLLKGAMLDETLVLFQHVGNHPSLILYPLVTNNILSRKNKYFVTLEKPAS